jgi:RNA polymerase sigma factor (sigma-70 family)
MAGTSNDLRTYSPYAHSQSPISRVIHMSGQERGPVSTAIAGLPVLENNDLVTQLFVEHYRRVLMAGYRITGNMADAEDVAQAVFMRLGRGDLPVMANAASYLYRAAVNRALDLLRRKKLAGAEPLESAANIAAGETTVSPEARILDLELRRLLRQAIAELGSRAAEIFTLRYLEGLGNREIATLMETSHAVVAVTLYQSRRKLRRRLTELLRGMG